MSYLRALAEYFPSAAAAGALPGTDDPTRFVPRGLAVLRVPLIPSWSDTVVPTVTLGKFDDRMIPIPRPRLVSVRTFTNADIIANVQAAAGTQTRWDLVPLTGPSHTFRVKTDLGSPDDLH